MSLRHHVTVSQTLFYHTFVLTLNILWQRPYKFVVEKEFGALRGDAMRSLNNFLGTWDGQMKILHSLAFQLITHSPYIGCFGLKISLEHGFFFFMQKKKKITFVTFMLIFVGYQFMLMCRGSYTSKANPLGSQNALDFFFCIFCCTNRFFCTIVGRSFVCSESK